MRCKVFFQGAFVVFYLKIFYAMEIRFIGWLFFRIFNLLNVPYHLLKWYCLVFSLFLSLLQLMPKISKQLTGSTTHLAR